MWDPSTVHQPRCKGICVGVIVLPMTRPSLTGSMIVDSFVSERPYVSIAEACVAGSWAWDGTGLGRTSLRGKQRRKLRQRQSYRYKEILPLKPVVRYINAGLKTEKISIQKISKDVQIGPEMHPIA